MNDGRKEYIVTWIIENYSHCWHKKNEALASPAIIIDGLEGTFHMTHFPRGYNKQDSSVYLYRRKSVVHGGSENLTLEYELSVLAADGSAALKSENCEMAHNKDSEWVCLQRLRIYEILLLQKADYLPQDTLNLRCRIWKNEDNLQKVTQISVRTRIGIEHVSFLHSVERFSELQPNEKNTVTIQLSSQKKCVFSSSLYLTDGSCCEKRIMVKITSSNPNKILSKCKLSLLDQSGKLIECGQFSAIRKYIYKMSLSLTRQVILNRKSEYLPGNKLSVICECVFSSKLDQKYHESTLHEIPSVALNQIIKNDEKDNVAELSHYPSALDDLKSFFNNKFLSDVELKTKTKSFPAHKIVLCARSPVFKVMMSNDMKENNTDCIKIDDLDDEIVHQLLLFLYCDCLEILQWETATKLYYAADKFKIEKLRAICSNFLKDNLNTSNAIEILVLSDTLKDSDLKKFVEDFILNHDEEVFDSDEWEKLIEDNPQLVIKTMHLKYKRRKVH